MAKKLLCVVGTRPNFVKAAPLMRELNKYTNDFTTKLVHTGQHYDQNLSDWLFNDLGMAPPDISLGVGSGSHTQQTAKIMLGIEEAVIAEKADIIVVFGDVNSTLAAAVVAAKMGVKMAHVESGLRSFDRTMPEEINRIVTDHLSDYLFVTEESGMRNLRHEGIADEKVFFTGNIMIDSLLETIKVAERSEVLEQLGLQPQGYALMTLHRPSNVDHPETLRYVLETIGQVAQRIPVVFPCHPRTQQNIARFGLEAATQQGNLMITEPLGYVDFCRLTHKCKFVLTDSGGIQEETTYLQIPCITMRENTERPITVDVGTNVMTGNDRAKILQTVAAILDGAPKRGRIPELWDGHAAKRIVEILRKV
ncbi:MAG: UDP-N-acetylglucosamine 2-epimerase (non-hydrolyzing) [candidate division Zixibacteria bacterium]|nr:UDP-N-acetylglucosamine 2-epimerase (non-hydrolyzing) [candidate division Zixibacteria bacterium]